MDKHEALKGLAINRYIERLNNLLEETESPIEKQLLLGFLNTQRLTSIGNAGSKYALSLMIECENVYIIPQEYITPKIRVDFVIVVLGGAKKNYASVVIECDGHDFHEKTKEQAKKDKARDRKITAEGYKILRFTGSEIYNDLDRCIQEITDLIKKEIKNV